MPRINIPAPTFFIPVDGCCDEKDLLNGSLGNGLCPSIPTKLGLVGVAGADSSLGAVTDREGAILGARGVVGVVASYSFGPRPMLTD